MTFELENRLRGLKANDQWKNAVKKNLFDLCKHMEPDHGLIDCLIGVNVLSKRAAENCRIKPIRYDRNRAVLEVLLTRPFDDFVKFCSALHQTQQGHIPNCFLESGGIPPAVKSETVVVYERERDATDAVPDNNNCSFDWATFIRRHLSDLIDVIDPDHGLIPILSNKGVIPYWVADKYKDIEGRSSRVQEILLDLIKKSDADFKNFCDSLHETNQSHVVSDYLSPAGDGRSRLRRSNTCPCTTDLADTLVPFNWKASLIRQQSNLIDELDPNIDLINYLEKAGVMSKQVAERCKEIQPDSNRTVFILDFMKMRPDRDFLQFCQGLESTNQKHVVDKHLKPDDNFSAPVQESMSAPTSLMENLDIENDRRFNESVRVEEQQRDTNPNNCNNVEPQLMELGIADPCGGCTFTLPVTPDEEIVENIVQPVQEECIHVSQNNEELRQEPESGYGSRVDSICALKAVSVSHDQPLRTRNRSIGNERLAGNEANVPPVNEVPQCFNHPIHDDLVLRYRPMPLNSVEVRSSTRQFYDANCSMSYPMNKPCRGRCLIFNNHMFRTMRERTGTAIDSGLLQILFKKLLFRVEVIKDASAERIKSTLGALSRDRTLANDQCLVVFVLSHGDFRNGKCIIYGSDENAITLDDICDPFAQSPGGFMNGKPKLVFIQACRGEQYDCTQSDAPYETEMHLHVPRSYPDFLIGYPTQAGYRAFRDVEHGSWYINALTNVFMTKAHSTGITSMMNQVAGVASRWLSQTGNPETNNKTQFAKYECSFTKDLFFFPGIFE